MPPPGPKTMGAAALGSVPGRKGWIIANFALHRFFLALLVAASPRDCEPAGACFGPLPAGEARRGMALGGTPYWVVIPPFLARDPRFSSQFINTQSYKHLMK